MLQWNGDDLMRQVKAAADRISGRVSLPDLMNPDFMRRHTKYSSLDEMVADCELGRENLSRGEPRAILESQEWDQFVRDNSAFASWPQMMEAAISAHVDRALEV
jgi:hypothetical protein